MYLRIKTRAGKYSAFELNPPQIELYRELCEQKRKGEPMRINILKARQLGFSTFIAAIIFVLTILVPNQTACIIADTAEHATNLFKKYKFYYANLPNYLKAKLPTIASNAKELSIDYGMGQTSTVRVLVQGENAGRSDTAQYLHLSEVAFWKDIEDTTTSILQTVDDNNENSIIFYETTANGVNYYKEIWDTDVGGDTGYKALFFAWSLDPNNRRPYDGFELFDWEKKLMEEEDLELDQIAWYRVQFNKMHGNLRKLRQELPTTPLEAFIVNGSSKFNMDLILARKAELAKLGTKAYLKRGFFQYKKQVNQDGSQIAISDIRWIDSPTGEIKIYEEPQNGMPYIANNDPANGGDDYFVTQVINNYTGQQVAVYRKNHCDADECAYQMYCLLKYYGDCLACGETNTTSYILKLIHKCGYRFIYQDTDYEALGGRYIEKFGYKTKQNNRNVQLDMLAEIFRDNPNVIRDYNTICEMETFQVIVSDDGKKSKVEAASGKHDDCVMALAGAYFIRHAQRAIPRYSQEVVQRPIYDPLSLYEESRVEIVGDYIWD